MSAFKWPDGTPLSLRATRRLIVAIAPVVMFAAFFGTLLRGFKDAFVYAWLDVRGECAFLRREWRGEP